MLGVDPGLTRCGVGVIDVGARRELTFVSVDVIRTPPEDDIQTRLGAVGDGLKKAVDRYSPDAVCFERVYAGDNRPTGMGVAQVTGVLMYLAHERQLPSAWYTPTQVKAAVSGYGQADKAQVQNMVKRILNLSFVPKPADAADALAIAICHAFRGASAVAPTVETAAQRIWRDAERHSKGRGSASYPGLRD